MSDFTIWPHKLPALSKNKPEWSDPCPYVQSEKGWKKWGFKCSYPLLLAPPSWQWMRASNCACVWRRLWQVRLASCFCVARAVPVTDGDLGWIVVDGVGQTCLDVTVLVRAQDGSQHITQLTVNILIGLDVQGLLLTEIQNEGKRRELYRGSNSNRNF